MLILLARNPGRAIEKREILDTVWRDTFVIEDVLVQAVREIRRALEDDKDDLRYVQTVPRAGYRFVGEVTALPSPTPVPLRQLTFGVGTAVKPAFSPDGRMLLYVSEPEETPGVLDLFVMPAEGGNSWRITDRLDPRGDLPVFTADGTAVVFSRYRGGETGSRASLRTGGGWPTRRATPREATTKGSASAPTAASPGAVRTVGRARQQRDLAGRPGRRGAGAGGR